MRVVLASRDDASASRLVARWGEDARLLTSRDLSTKGWRYRPGHGSTAIIAGTAVDEREIDGVLIRLPAVAESELRWIAPADRGYVAAEMTAFLAAWLSDLPGRVLNRPSPVHLMGPAWPREHWIRAAWQLGIATCLARTTLPRSAPDEEVGPADRLCVTVIDGRAVGRPPRWAARAARALAGAAGVGMLRACFVSAEEHSGLLDADYWVDLEDSEVSDAIHKSFARRRR